MKSYKGVPLKRVDYGIKVSTENFVSKPIVPTHNGFRSKTISGYMIDIEMPFDINHPMSLSDVKYRIDEVIKEKNSHKKVYAKLASYIDSYVK